VHRFHDIKGIAIVETDWLKLRFISALNFNDSNYKINKNNFNITFSLNKLVWLSWYAMINWLRIDWKLFY